MNIPLLQVQNLTVKLRIEGKAYPVVRDLNLELKRGQTVALVGESGCGKSMTALALMRILPATPRSSPRRRDPLSWA